MSKESQRERLQRMRALRKQTRKLRRPKPKPKPKPRKKKPMISRPRVHKDGSLAYPKRGWEPPPVPDGFVRKSENLKSPDAWVFIPKFKKCPHRVLKEGNVMSCGCMRMTLYCDQSGELLKVLDSQCRHCDHSC